jgi:hypothetical protein
MKLLVYSTKPDGYWWKAPSWKEGVKLSLESPVEMEIEGEDLDHLMADIKDGFYLRYKGMEAAVSAEESPQPKAKKK